MRRPTTSSSRRGFPAKFDGIFFADTEGVYSEWEGSPDGAIRFGCQVPCFEPTVLMTYVAAVTRHLGLAFTLTTTSYPPYVTARKFATLDHLSDGRAAWNVVTGFHHAAFQNLGIADMVDHDTRYDRADEYLDVCYRLWESWDPDAVVLDVDDMFADPTKVHTIDFEGPWFSCRGPLNVHRSPQGKPVIVQAGGSPRGRDFAATHADMVFAIQTSAAAMKEYRDDVRERAARHGRDPDGCKVLFALQTFVAETEAQAREAADFHNAMANPLAGLVWLSGVSGADYSQHVTSMVDSVDVLRNVERPGIQTAPRVGGGGDHTVLDMAVQAARGGFMQVVGTGEQIADQMEATMAEVGGDGFFLSPAYVPGSIDEFMDDLRPDRVPGTDRPRSAPIRSGCLPRVSRRSAIGWRWTGHLVTSTAHRTPGASASRRSPVSNTASMASASATYDAS